jgi:hypothetical protein
VGGHLEADSKPKAGGFELQNALLNMKRHDKNSFALWQWQYNQPCFLILFFIDPKRMEVQ